MKRILTLLCFCSLFFAILANAGTTENAFYMLRKGSAGRTTPYEVGFADLTQHASKIPLLIGQAYHIDQAGVVTGSIDEQTVQFAKAHSIKLLVLITNTMFDNAKAHIFLANEKAQKSAIQAILTLCQKNHYAGVQFDFEGIKMGDRDPLTHFLKEATAVLHAQGFIVSFAVVPTVSEKFRTTDFLKRKYKNWSGVYDLKALGEIGDSITIMSYDQHSSGTTPGPFAGAPWVEETILNTLQFVPANKVSLGIVTYSGTWQTSNPSGRPNGRISVNLASIPYSAIQPLLQKFHASLVWNETDSVYYAMFNRNFLNEYIFVEDARSLKAKMNLVKKYHLRGISLFDLGNEDPAIWNVL